MDFLVWIFVRRGFGCGFLFHDEAAKPLRTYASTNPYLFFTPKSTPNKSPQNPPPAAQWPCHCCSCHFSLTCENDRVPSSMITAIRGRQRECCVLLDGSQVQQNSNNMFGGKKNVNSHEIHSAKKRAQYYVYTYVRHFLGPRLKNRKSKISLINR